MVPTAIPIKISLQYYNSIIYLAKPELFSMDDTSFKMISFAILPETFGTQLPPNPVYGIPIWGGHLPAPNSLSLTGLVIHTGVIFGTLSEVSGHSFTHTA